MNQSFDIENQEVFLTSNNNQNMYTNKCFYINFENFLITFQITKTYQLSDHEKGQIIAFKTLGWSNQKISDNYKNSIRQLMHT